MLSLTFDQIMERLVTVELPRIDLVIGIGRGGTVPAALTAFRLNCPLQVVQVNYRDEKNDPCRDEPQLLSALEVPPDARSVLIVDDVGVTGKTLKTVASRVTAEKKTTFVFKGKADIVLFPEIGSCVLWPWKDLKGQGE